MPVGDGGVRPRVEVMADFDAIDKNSKFGDDFAECTQRYLCEDMISVPSQVFPRFQNINQDN